MFKSRLTIPFLILTITLFSTMLARATSPAGSGAARLAEAARPKAGESRAASTSCRSAAATTATRPGSLDRKVPSPTCRAG